APMTAASGNRTMTLRYPAERSPGSGRLLRTRRDSETPLDPGHDPVLRIEELRDHLAPASEVLDREELRAERQVLLVRDPDRVVDRAVAVLRPDLLPLLRVEELVERLDGRVPLALRQDGERVLDRDRRLRDQVVDRLALRLGQLRLVLVGEQ